MKSRWGNKKEDALRLRREGQSIRDIEISLGIPRSTLSGWFKDIQLSASQQEALNQRHRTALIKARVFAAAAHRNTKQRRIESIKKAAQEQLDLFSEDDITTLELALAMLYLGEGAKTKQGLRLGNSNPLIMRFYIHALVKVYKLPLESLYFALHLRADQDENTEKLYWSEALDVPLSRFTYFIKDPRTAGRPTRPEYHGVCLASGGPVEIQRRLMYLSEAFCERAVRA